MMISYKPIKKEKEYYCGPACLKIVFNYYGIIKSQKEWARLSGTTRNGVQNQGMINAIRSVGFSCKILKEINLSEFKKIIDSKKTVIVIWWLNDWGHYSVVVKITKRHIFLADPNIGGIRKLKLKQFDHLWFNFSKDYNRKPSDLELRTAILIYR